MIHLTTHQLSSYLDGELPASSQELVRRHLDGCSECARRFAAIGEQEAILDRVLVHDPGEEFFEGFADQVLGTRTMAARPVAKEPLPEHLVAKEPVTSRPVAMEHRIQPDPELRPASTRQPAVPWFAAAILCLIVGAIGYVLPRPAATPRGAAAPHEATAARHEATAAAAPLPAERQAPEPVVTPPSAPPPREATPGETGSQSVSAGETPPVAAPRAKDLPPTESIIPVRRLITTTEVSAVPRESSLSPSAPPTSIKPPATQALDEFAAAPESSRPLIAAARQAAQATALDSSAANLDATGNAWEQAVPALSGAEQMLARQNLAEARYKAWVAAPDPYRAAAATASLRTFLVLSPPGPRRDLAKEWLKRAGGGVP